MIFLERREKPFWIVVGLSLAIAISALDYKTGSEYASSLFYLIPISMTAWYAGRVIGIGMSVVSAILWFVADIAAGHPYSSRFVYTRL